jgi:hypothetical protein
MPTEEMSAEEFKALARKNQLEDDFQNQVIEYAQLHGWKVAHFHKVKVQAPNGSVRWITPVAADGKGFPDLVFVRDRVVYAELKKQGGAWKPEQREWSAWLVIAKAEVYGWQPSDWPEIERVLGGKR